MNILVFGDSIAWAAFDLVSGGWVEIIKKKLMHDHFVYNLSISGTTSADITGWDRISRECQVRKDYEEGNIIILAFGINDASKIDGVNRVPINEFEANLKEIIEHSLDYTENIFLVGLTPVKESKTMPVSWDNKLTYENSDIDKYNHVIKKVANEMNIPFIDVNSLVLPEHLIDGVHINHKAHQLIADKVFYEIIEKNPDLK